MNPLYQLRDPSTVFSPALLFYKEQIRKNIASMIARTGGTERLRPHVKTHKTREIVRLELDTGITKHKVATLAEAEMVASCGAPDVLLAYPMVGPNCQRMAQLMKIYPKCRFSVLADHPLGAKALAEAMSTAGLRLDVLMDVDVGQHRTGIAPGEQAGKLYTLISKLAGLRADGFHVYDGHNHQENLADRTEAVNQQLAPVLAMRATLEHQGIAVPRLVVGGTPTFPVWAKMNLPGLECSPGTCVLNDHGYGSKFTDLDEFAPAALLLTRVISRPTPRRLTLDLGYKAVASDPPAGKRCVLFNVPEYEPILQNEEHFVVESPAAETFVPGDVVYALPTHICPTCAMHQKAYVVEDGQVTAEWPIAGRDRMLTV